jgi:hypothetical protein
VFECFPVVGITLAISNPIGLLPHLGNDKYL